MPADGAVAQSLRPASLPGRARILRGIAYGPLAMQELDLFLPAEAKPAPLLVYCHGGGWISGSRGGGNKIGAALSVGGYAVASLDYRLIPDTDAAGQAADIAHACAYLLRHAASLGVEPGRFALAGHSAGGHLACLVALDAQYFAAAGVPAGAAKAVLPLDGVYDIAADIARNARHIDPRVFGPAPGPWRDFSPAHHAQRMAPGPVFGLVWETTNPRFMAQGEAFAAALQQHGHRVEILRVPGLKHGEIASRIADADQPMLGFMRNILAETLPSG